MKLIVNNLNRPDRIQNPTLAECKATIERCDLFLERRKRELEEDLLYYQGLRRCLAEEGENHDNAGLAAIYDTHIQQICKLLATLKA